MIIEDRSKGFEEDSAVNVHMMKRCLGRGSWEFEDSVGGSLPSDRSRRILWCRQAYSKIGSRRQEECLRRTRSTWSIGVVVGYSLLDLEAHD